MKNFLFYYCLLSSGILLAQVNEDKGSVMVNGVALHYQTQGSGEPLVIIHGGPGMDDRYLFPGMDELGENYRLISYNQRGSGKSAADLDTMMINVDQYVDDLEGFRKAMGLDKVNLLGHSWGGLLAMKYAIKHPERLTSLILVSTAGADESVGLESQGIMMQRLSPEDQQAYFQMLSDGHLNSLEGIQLLSKIHWKPYVYDQAHLSLIKDAYSENMPLIQHHINKSLKGYDLHGQLSKIRTPTLIIHGDYDPIPLAAAEQIHRAIPGSKFEVIKECGHFPFIEQPEKFIEVIKLFTENRR